MSSGNSRLKSRKPKPLKMNRQQELAFSRLVFGVVDSCTDHYGRQHTDREVAVMAVEMIRRGLLEWDGKTWVIPDKVQQQFRTMFGSTGP